MKLWAGRAIPYSAPPDDRGGDFKQAFPGLSMKNGTRELKLGRVEFISEGKKVAMSFVFEHESIPGLE